MMIRNAWFCFRMLFLLPLIGAGIRVFGFRRTRQWLETRLRSGSKSHPEKGGLDEAHSISRLVLFSNRRAAFHRETCLPESLTLWYVLRRKGLPAVLQIGAAKPSGSFTAHAWVEVEGQCMNDDPETLQSYASFDLGPS